MLILTVAEDASFSMVTNYYNEVILCLRLITGVVGSFIVGNTSSTEKNAEPPFKIIKGFLICDRR